MEVKFHNLTLSAVLFSPLWSFVCLRRSAVDLPLQPVSFHVDANLNDTYTHMHTDALLDLSSPFCVTVCVCIEMTVSVLCTVAA